MVKSIVASYESQEKNGHKFRFSINLRRKLSSENFCRKRQGRRVRDEPSKGRVGGAGVPEEQRGPDALRRVSQGGPADHIESHGVDGEDVQLSREGDGEILVRARGRGDASTPRRLPERDRTHGQVLGRSARDGDWAAALPSGRVIKEIANRVVHPAAIMRRTRSGVTGQRSQ